MITFIEFLTEAASGSDADKEGKVHELLTGWHLNHLIHGEGAHMSHFRDSTGKTPEEALAHHTKKMTQAQKDHHNKKAKQAATAIYNNIKKHQPHILSPNKKAGEHVRVTWTSQTHDIKNLTGKDDVGQHAGAADLMVSKHNKFGHVEHDDNVHGASLKYLKKKSKVGLSNRGGSSLEKQLGMKKGTITDHDDDHDKRMTEHFNEKRANARHEQFKLLRDKEKNTGKKLTPTEKAKMDVVKKSDQDRCSKQAKAIADHLNSMHPEHRAKHVRDLFGPEHTHPTHQYRTNSDTEDETHVEKGSDVTAKAFSGEHHIVAEGRFVKVKRGTKEKPGSTIGTIQMRSKGRPAGGASVGVPTFNAEASK